VNLPVFFSKPLAAWLGPVMPQFPKLVVEVMTKKHRHSLSNLQPGLKAALGYPNADGKKVI